MKRLAWGSAWLTVELIATNAAALTDHTLCDTRQ
jgi:hypothetical protein